MKKLLYIDDELSLLSLFTTYFERRNFHVLTAADGEEGLDLFAQHDPDIVLLDLKMPKFNGLQVLDAIKTTSPDTPVIVISGEGEMADAIQALRYGAWNYHVKPIKDLSIIQHAVEQALEKSGLIQENKAYQKGLEKLVKERTRALQQSEEKLSAIIDNFDGFVLTCDIEFRITYMNPAFQKYAGEEALGKFCHEVLFGKASVCPSCPWKKEFLAEESISKQEIRNPKNGRWYYAIHSPLYDKDGQVSERQIVFYDITERKEAFIDLQEREEHFRKENIRLRTSLIGRYKFGAIIGKSKPMQKVYELILNAAATDASVVIYGESGTGKELVAKSIHEHSDRREKELIYINCGAIPENLIESEFFGYCKGAFTGAETDKKGLLELADGGTLFLDEVGDIPLSMQVKLLRAIEGCGYTPVGGNEVRKPDIRVIAATNRDLKELVKKGDLRQEFLYRIHVIPIHLPPLRERQEDLRLLIDHFLSQYDPDTIPPITSAILKALQGYGWAGNVRELQNTIHRFVTLKKLDFMGLDLADPPGGARDDQMSVELGDTPLGVTLQEFEKKLLFQMLEKHKWHQGNAAKALHIDRKTLYRKMKQFGIKKHSSE